jgi:hypothetical protein
MTPVTQVVSEFGPAAIERVEWLAQRDLGAPVPASEPGDDGSAGRWARFLRDGHAPRFPLPGGVEVATVDPGGSESFGSTAAFGLGLPARDEAQLAALPGLPGWRCYVALGGKAPAAAAVFTAGGVALLALDASREAGRRSPARMALLHRAIADAVEAGAARIGARVDLEADAPRKETAAGLLLAGFHQAYPCPTWVDAGIPAS